MLQLDHEGRLQRDKQAPMFGDSQLIAFGAIAKKDSYDELRSLLLRMQISVWEVPTLLS